MYAVECDNVTSHFHLHRWHTIMRHINPTQSMNASVVGHVVSALLTTDWCDIPNYKPCLRIAPLL